MKHALAPADILSNEDYARVRDERRRAIMAMKKNRRVGVGPCATFYFENYDTMWLQVQEILRAEKSGAEALTDELEAYNPLIPKGRELVATVMFEVEDPAQRAALLSALGGVEDHMELRIGGDIVRGQPERDLEYTAADGKASAVQFVHFALTPEQIASFCGEGGEVALAVTHPAYRHIAFVPQNVRDELGRDFAS